MCALLANIKQEKGVASQAVKSYLCALLGGAGHVGGVPVWHGAGQSSIVLLWVEWRKVG